VRSSSVVYQISLFTATIYVSLPFVLTTIFTMSKNQEQRICFNFCVFNEISCWSI